MTLSKISMRYPPFDRDRTNPAELDVMECVVRSDSHLAESIEIGKFLAGMPIGNHLMRSTRVKSGTLLLARAG